LRGFRTFGGLALVFLLGVRRGGRRLALVLGVIVATLGKCASNAEQENGCGNREMAQDPALKWKHPSTHKFPDFLPELRQTQHGDRPVMPSK
jgi:hypothetical protein